MSQTSEFDLLMIGVDDATSKGIQPFIDGLQVRTMSTPQDIEALLEGIQLAPGMLVLVSNGIKEMSPFEIGQALSSSYNGIHIVFVTFDRAAFELTTLKKNGFTEILLLPLDNKNLEAQVSALRSSKSGAFKKYKAVKLLDIKPNQELPFEVSTYLALNNKYVKLTSSGKLSEKKAQMLKTKNISSVFIDTSQIDAFYEFAADQMISMGLSGNDAVSQTEKDEQFQSTVRELFRSFLDVSEGATGDLNQGRDLLEQSKKVVENYVIKKTGVDLRAKFNEIIGLGGDSYSHAQSVSTIASLLSMATGIGQPEELAIAGLFHDIGMVGIRDDISIFDLPNLDEAERTAYMAHPRQSLTILREKRVTLVPMIAEMIEKHHERVDGRGFPAQLASHKIPNEAQLLSYADAFEHLSHPKPGVPILTPKQIHAKISAEVGISLEVLLRIEKFVLAPDSSSGEASNSGPAAAG